MTAAVANRYRVFRDPDRYESDLVGVNSPYRPVGNFLFLGPTGSGKSGLRKAAAESMVVGTPAIVEIDCGDLQHGHASAKMFGTPPAHIEYCETHPLLSQNILTQYHPAIIKRGFALFGGLKKTSHGSDNLLHDVLDKATLTLGAKIGAWISLAP